MAKRFQGDDPNARNREANSIMGKRKVQTTNQDDIQIHERTESNLPDLAFANTARRDGWHWPRGLWLRLSA